MKLLIEPMAALFSCNQRFSCSALRVTRSLPSAHAYDFLPGIVVGLARFNPSRRP
jgi:hypothetical protein